MSETWDDPAAVPAAIGGIELVIKWPDSDAANVELFANVEVFDTGGNSLGLKYVRSTAAVKNLLTAAQRTGIDAVGATLRIKAETKLLP